MPNSVGTNIVCVSLFGSEQLGNKRAVSVYMCPSKVLPSILSWLTPVWKLKSVRDKSVVTVSIMNTPGQEWLTNCKAYFQSGMFLCRVHEPDQTRFTVIYKTVPKAPWSCTCGILTEEQLQLIRITFWVPRPSRVNLIYQAESVMTKMIQRSSNILLVGWVWELLWYP